MISRQAIIDDLMAEFEARATGPCTEFSGDYSIIIAGVQISAPAAIAKLIRLQLERRLPTVESFKTCEDFKHLNARCCDSCHGTYEIYEMRAVPLAEGQYAWVCCALNRAIRPEWNAEQDRRFAMTAAGKLLNRMFKKKD